MAADEEEPSEEEEEEEVVSPEPELTMKQKIMAKIAANDGKNVAAG